MNIYVGNLNYKVREEDLQQVFGQYGTVDSAKVIKDKHTGRSKGFGFVEMKNDEEAQRAIDGLNNTEVFERKIIASVAKEPKNRDENR